MYTIFLEGVGDVAFVIQIHGEPYFMNNVAGNINSR